MHMPEGPGLGKGTHPLSAMTDPHQKGAHACLPIIAYFNVY